MAHVIIAGLPPDLERRVRAALKDGPRLSDDWSIGWIPAKGRTPGLAPSQVDRVLETASQSGGAHILVFRGQTAREETVIAESLLPYFRFRWLDKRLLALIPHEMSDLIAGFQEVLREESEWRAKVLPRDESCCLLLPECAFVCDERVKYLWSIAAQSGMERINGAVRAMERFESLHWLPHVPPGHYEGGRAWVDTDARVFKHKGPRHAASPFPRSWKFSFELPSGFHFDVTSNAAFHVIAWDKTRHGAAAFAHVNIDPHGHVR